MTIKDQTDTQTTGTPPEGASNVQVDPSLYEEAKAKEAAADASLQGETVNATDDENAPDGDDRPEDPDEEFTIPGRTGTAAKYAAVGAMVVALIVAIVFLGNRLTTSGPSSDRTTAVTPPPATTDSPASTPAPAGPTSAPPPSSVTVTVPALDRFDLSGCSRENLEITAEGVWVFRNCAQPVLPSSSR